MDSINALLNIGLNEKEAKVYLALLQMGKATAYSVSRISSLKKPTTYVILENLIDKGFAQKIPRAKKMLYTPIDPEDLFSIVKGKLKNAETTLPELKALYRGKEYKTKVSYYEGLAGVKELYKKILKENAGQDLAGFYGHAENTPKELLDYWEEFNKERVQKKITGRGITPQDKTTENWINNQEKYLLDVKALPREKYDSNVSIEVYKNFTQIISFRHLQGILIDNPDLAKAIKQILEIVWEKLPEEEEIPAAQDYTKIT